MADALPIDADLDRIAAAVRETGAVVVVAPPGAGKTTRVPARLVAEGARVVCTQPRRIAARLAARRVARELGGEVGGLVGYEVRFERAVGEGTRLRFQTEGVALRQMAGGFGDVDVLIVDELHERHLAGDALLALARRARPGLSIVAMSATLDAARVADYLGAPVIETAGRAHPVEIEHLPQPATRPLEVEVAAALRQVVADDGDVLVFLPGVAEIRRVAARCADFAAHHGLELLPLHGGLSPAEQDRAVTPGARRRVILATNVAETSLTIEGVTAVIDSGLARVARHSPWSGVQSLQVEPVSKASATQRAGRAGRTRPGRCSRLYTRHDFDTRREHDAPEIARADLADLALQLRAAGVALGELRWLDAPPEAAAAAAEELLRDLGAVDAAGALTEIGAAMQRLPVHPRQARVAIEAARLGAPRAGCAVAALLGERPLSLARRAGEPAAHESDSDLLDDLDELCRVEAARFRGRGTDLAAARAAARGRDQLVRLVGGARDQLDGAERDQALARAILAGYADRVARRRAPKSAELVVAGGTGATLSRASAVLGADFLVATDAELRGRGGDRAVLVRSATAIDPAWLLELPGIDERDELVFDRERRRVERRAAILYRGVIVDEERSADPARLPAAASAVLADAALAAGIERFVDPAALATLRGRVDFVRALPGAPAVPALDDAALAAAVRDVCEQLGATSFAELEAADLLAAVEASWPADARAALARLAPTHVAIPGRKRVPVHYEPDRPPWIESRLQDFFGAERGPAVGGGAVPLVLHLLAPNRRAVQVTSDLAGFWERHYPDIRRQLMRRYPRHAWPESPR